MTDVISEEQQQLLAALKDGQLSVFKALLKHPDVNPSYSYGKPEWGTCLEIACRLNDRAKFVEQLLTVVKPNRNILQPEPIHIVAKKGNYSALQVLLRDKRIKINAEDKDGRTALHIVARNFGQDPCSYERCLDLLLARSDLDVNRPNRHGCTAIHEAADSGCKDAVLAFLNRRPAGLDMDSQRGVGKTAREKILDAFPNLRPLLPPIKVAPTTSEPQTNMLAALQNNYLAVFKQLLQQVNDDGSPLMNPDFFYSQPFNCTCLELACAEERLDKYVDVLMGAGADPNIVNLITEMAPIHVAVKAANVRALKILLNDNRTNVNILDKDSNSPLHCAVKFFNSEEKALHRNSECIKMLLEHKSINVNIRNNFKHSPIMEAALDKNERIVALIIGKAEMTELFLDLDTADDNGLTARKVINGNFPKISLPPFQMCPTASVERLKENLFECLYKHKTKDFGTLLNQLNEDELKAMIDIDDGSNTFLQHVCCHGYDDEAKLLMKKGANPNRSCDTNKKPPIVIACLKENYNIVRLLLGHKSLDVNATDRKGNTALHIAAKHKRLDAVVDLINYGADVRAKNVFGQKPLSYISMKRLFDLSLICDKDHFPEDDDYHITFKYDLLLSQPRIDKKPRQANHSAFTVRSNNDLDVESNKSSRAVVSYSELEFLLFVADDDAFKDLLKHPIVTSFLSLKWPKLKKLYLIDVAWCSVFVFCVSAFISLNCNSHDGRYCPTGLKITFFVLIGFLMLLLIAREIFQLWLSKSRYVEGMENWLDITMIVFTALACFVLWPDETRSDTISVLSVISSWTKLILTSGRLPLFSRSFHMFKKVALNYAQVLVWYSLLLIMFAISFYVFFGKTYEPRANQTSNDGESFNSTNIVDENFAFWFSFFRVIVMMTGEFDSGSINFDKVPVISHAVFAIFIFLIAIVLLNLLTGLAVSDIQKIKDEADILSLQSRIKLMYDTEGTMNWLPILRRVNYIDDVRIFANGPTKINVCPNQIKRKIESPWSDAWVCFTNGNTELQDYIESESLSLALKIITENSVCTNKICTKNDVDEMKQEITHLIQMLIKKVDDQQELSRVSREHRRLISHLSVEG